MKNYFKLIVLLISISIITLNCKKDEYKEINNLVLDDSDRPATHGHQFSIQDLLNNDETFAKLSDKFLKEDLLFSGSLLKNSNGDSLTITSDTVNVVEKKDYKSYTIRVKRKGKNFDTENLVIENKKGEDNAFIIGYKFDNDWIEQKAQGIDTAPRGRLFYTPYETSFLKSESCYQITITITIPCSCGHSWPADCNGCPSQYGPNMWPSVYETTQPVCDSDLGDDYETGTPFTTDSSSGGGGSTGGGGPSPNPDSTDDSSQTEMNLEDMTEFVEFKINKLISKLELNSAQANWVTKNIGDALELHDFCSYSGWNIDYNDWAKAQIVLNTLSSRPRWTSTNGKINNRDNLEYNKFYSNGIYNHYLLTDGSYVIESQSPLSLNRDNTLSATELSEVFDNSFFYIKPPNTDEWSNFIIPKVPGLAQELEMMFILGGQEFATTFARYVLPVEDIKIIITGTDLDGNTESRWLAAGFLVTSIVPGSKILKVGKVVTVIAKTEVFWVKVVKWGDKTAKLTYKVIDGIIDFGNRSQLAQLLGTTANIEAHHIIPWTRGGAHPVVQSAARNGFHLNMIENGLGLQKYTSLIGDGLHGNHPAYDTYVINKLETFKNQFPNFSPEQANNYLLNTLIPDLKNKIIAAKNSGLNLNEYFKKLI